MKKKRLVVCLDGTWQNIVQNAPTNIAHIAQSVAPFETLANGELVHQMTYYSRGVGAPAETGAQTWWNKLTGGGFGEGLEENVLSAYIFLSLNYEPDSADEIYIFGFSRGAYTARSLAGMIGKMGLLKRQQVANAGDVFKAYRHQEADVPAVFLPMLHARVSVKYLGIFDTVGMRGIPSRGGIDVFGHNKKYRFHDLRLRPHVLSARHACAIDERRNTLPVTPWTNLKFLNEAVAAKEPFEPNKAPYQQKWFAGQHGDVGGGLENGVLSDIPLRWIADGAAQAGLAFSGDSSAPYVKRCTGRRCAPLTAATPAGGGFLNALGKEDRVIDLWNRRVTDENDDAIAMPASDCATADELRQHLHPATLYRVVASDRYYPKTLEQFHGLPAAGVFARLFNRPRKQDARDFLVAGMESGRTDFTDYDDFEKHLVDQRLA